MEYHSDTGEKKVQSVGENTSKCKKRTLDELVLLKIIKRELTITQKELALKVGKSERTIKNEQFSYKKRDTSDDLMVKEMDDVKFFVN